MQFRYQPALYSPPHTNVVLSASHIEILFLHAQFCDEAAQQPLPWVGY